jgi:hypothetical protein
VDDPKLKNRMNVKVSSSKYKELKKSENDNFRNKNIVNITINNYYRLLKEDKI